MYKDTAVLDYGIKALPFIGDKLKSCYIFEPRLLTIIKTMIPIDAILGTRNMKMTMRDRKYHSFDDKPAYRCVNESLIIKEWYNNGVHHRDFGRPHDITILRRTNLKSHRYYNDKDELMMIIHIAGKRITNIIYFGDIYSYITDYFDTPHGPLQNYYKRNKYTIDIKTPQQA